jgi:3-deoxy-D-manno-octulosonic-acid transferase
MQNVQLFLAQSDEDARRLIQIGALAERVRVSGNLKFEVKPPADSPVIRRLKDAIEREQIGPMIVAGSTLDGEETMLLETFRAALKRYPGTTLVLAPRHPERFEAVASLLASSGVQWQRRSDWDGERPIVSGVFLLDSIGELASFYQFADLAFVGGSLVAKGGHNVLEAAQFGVPILVGPWTENFRDIVEIFRRANALQVVTPESFTATVLWLLEDFAERERMGQRAREVIQAQQGATAGTVQALLELIPSSPLDPQPELTSGRTV